MVNGYAVNAAEVNGEVTLIAFAGSGAYSHQGFAQSLLKGSVATAGDAAYSFIGTDVTFLRGYAIVSSPTEYSLAVNDAFSVRGYQMLSESAAYTLVGFDARLDVKLFARADTGFTVVKEIRAFKVPEQSALSTEKGNRYFMVPQEKRTFSVGGIH